MPDLPEITVHSGAMFRCPKCEARTAFKGREYYRKTPPGVPRTEDDISGMSWPHKWWVCRTCKYELTDDQRRSACPMAHGGGVMLAAWGFDCPCGKRSFCDTTIYSGNGGEAPPSIVTCEHCLAHFRSK
jgi:hypothetical protein